MRIALTGATGFIGNYIVRHLAEQGHQLKCWYRQISDRSPLDDVAECVEWIPGELMNEDSARALVGDCDAVIHNAFWRPGAGFRGAEGDVVEFARVNMLGALQLVEQSMAAKAERFVFVSTCAVHEKILNDRPLDEAHPLWPMTHYGAHKAAIEKFVHSYGMGMDYPICAIRPTGVYGLRNPVDASKWFDLVSKVARGQDVAVQGGGKEVHAGDVAKAIGVLLQADGISGESFACYDRYISQHEVATIAKELSGSSSQIIGEPKTPKNQIETGKIRDLGMEFGSTASLRNTISQMLEAAKVRSG